MILLALLLVACGGDEDTEEAIPSDIKTLPDIPVKKDNDNNPPKLHKIGNKEAQINEELTVNLVADDADGDMLTFSVYGDMPPEAKFYKPDGKFVWTPTTAGGPFFVTFVVSDQKDFDSETVELRAVTAKTQHAPAFVELGDQNLKVGELYTLNLEATDEDGDLLYFSIQGAVPPGATFDAQNAVFKWTPVEADAGTLVRVTFAVSDGSLTDEMEVRLIVEGSGLNNHPPEVEPIGTVEAEVGKQVTIEIKATDNDGDDLACSTVDPLPDGAILDKNSCVFTWTPSAAYQGKSVYIVFVVSDGTYNVKEPADILVKGKAAACVDDEFELNNKPEEAKPITQGTFQGLSICDTELSPIDEDWFKLQLSSGEHLEATIEFDHSAGDLDMLLYKEAELSTPKFYSPTVGDVEVVSYTAESAGNYLLRIAGTQSMKYSVPYTLKVVRSTEVGCSQDEKEPNNNLNQATPVGGYLDGTPITGLTICPMDMDVFKVPLQCGDSLIASIEFQHSLGDLDLYLMDQTGEEVLAQSAGESDIETVLHEGASEAAPYFLAVAGYPEESTSNTYKLEVLVEEGGGCSNDDYEPNNSSGQATFVSQTQNFTELTVCCDEDWFSFPGGPGDVSIAVDFTGEGEMSAWFCNSTALNDKMALVCSNGKCTGNQQLPSQGTLYLAVSGAFGLNYSLDATLETGGTADSCQGNCDKKAGTCWCDEGCHQFGDCCIDICDVCGYCGIGA